MSARPEHLIRLANLHLIRDSAELEAEIAVKAPGWFITLYRRFQNRAAEAMAAMAFISTFDEMVALQREIKLYDAFIEEVRAFVSEGKLLDQQTTEDERNEILDLLSEQGEEGYKHAVDLGLIQPGPED
jgi:hypothetical protein